MKIIEELESLQCGNRAALFSGDTGLEYNGTPLFEFKAVLASLDALQLKYPKHRLFIGNKGDWDWSEFALFGEREETETEKTQRLKLEKDKKDVEEAKKQKEIEKLKKQAAKLGLKLSQQPLG